MKIFKRPPKKKSPALQGLRTAFYGACAGFFVFVLGTLLLSPASSLALKWPDAPLVGVLLYALRWGPLLVLAPLTTYLAGRMQSPYKWTFTTGLIAGILFFPIGITVAMKAFMFNVVELVITLALVIIGYALSILTFGKGQQHGAQNADESDQVVPQTLSQIDYAAVSKSLNAAEAQAPGDGAALSPAQTVDSSSGATPSGDAASGGVPGTKAL